MRMTLNATEAADALGLHRNTLQGWLRDGRIQGEKVGGEWRIPAEEVARMQKERSTLLEAGRGIEAAGVDLIEDVVVFDVYSGKPIEEGKKSVSIRITYRSHSQTLEDTTVNTLHQTLTQQLLSTFNADVPGEQV